MRVTFIILRVDVRPTKDDGIKNHTSTMTQERKHIHSNEYNQSSYPKLSFSRQLQSSTKPFIFDLVKSFKTASEAIQLGLVGLLTRPVIKAVFPSEKNITTSDQSGSNSNLAVEQEEDNTPSPASTELVSPQSTEPSSPVVSSLPPAHTSVPPLGGSVAKQLLKQAQQHQQEQEQQQEKLLNPPPVYYIGQPISQPIEQEPTESRSVEQQPTEPLKPITTEHAYLPQLYTQQGTHPINMAVVAHPYQEYNDLGTAGNDSVQDHDYGLSEKARNLDLNDRPSSRATHRTNRTTQTQGQGQGQATNEPEEEMYDRPSSRATHRTNRTAQTQGQGQIHAHHIDGPVDVADENVDLVNQHHNGPAFTEDGRNQTNLASTVDDESAQYRHEADSERQSSERPGFPSRASRSYVKPIPIVTTYEPELPEAAAMRQRKSVAGSTKAPSVKRASSKAGSVRSNKAPTINGDHHTRPASVNEHHVRSPSANGNYQDQQHVRSPSVASVRRLPQVNERENGFHPGEILTHQRQHELQGGNQGGNHRTSLQDQGPISRDRSTTFEEPEQHRVASPRPQSAFGYRPQPNLMAIHEGDRPDSRLDRQGQGQGDTRAGALSRNGTTLSRAGTLGRNGTLSRAANGGTIGARKGAFGRGAGASIGTQPEEVLGRDDIHQRAELSERILDDATLRRLSTMEKRDAKRLTKVIKAEAKSEKRAVEGSIKELERLTKLQREAASAERKSQLRLSKWTRNEHKARLRFLKEKERYEKVEADLRNAENDYEERRDHAAGLTSQVAEKTYELDDARAQKAADDREREVKLLALKNPAHS
ncbi:uncharacterized protein IL334_004143 [Kwoniella shivajii]|uniref:DNA binding protein Ncp1 n=1 Tax=Kwoniella shivajii TaxID=564305 RepID=A0ABZ1CZI4_9TREE|nr:hypothetical protein IL334_004143 [Kwoniella shivajii]